MRLTYVLIGAALLLAACLTATPIANAPAASTGVAISSDFHPSDAALLGATGRPQVVEFFAYW